MSGRQRAIFLDRDGTLVHSRHYPSRPEALVLYTGIEAGLKQLQEAGFRLIVVTNQSGIARGYFSETDLERMHQHLSAELARSGIRIDAYYHCPHHPEGSIPELAIRCDCRKPQPGMLLRAAADLDLDLTRCWLIGDILDDVEAGNRAGCRTILVDLETELPPTAERRRPVYVAPTTVDALAIILAREGLGPAADFRYLPASWREAAATNERKVAHR